MKKQQRRFTHMKQLFQKIKGKTKSFQNFEVRQKDVIESYASRNFKGPTKWKLSKAD